MAYESRPLAAIQSDIDTITLQMETARKDRATAESDEYHARTRKLTADATVANLTGQLDNLYIELRAAYSDTHNG